jgi:hypothetical protein
VDVELSSNDDVVPAPKPDAPIDQKVQVGDDTRDGGASSVEPTAPISIIPVVNPSAGRHGRKRPPPTTRRNRPIPQINHVLTQVELPLYRRPHNPLDLVAIEIIFGRIFVVFRQISQTVAADHDKPKKKMCHLPLKKMLAQK